MIVDVKVLNVRLLVQSIPHYVTDCFFFACTQALIPSLLRCGFCLAGRLFTLERCGATPEW